MNPEALPPQLPSFQLAKLLPYRLITTSARISAELERRVWREFKFNDAEWRVMLLVADTGQLSVTEVEKRSFVHKPKVAKAIHRLVAVGFLSKHREPADKRRQILTLTEHGVGMAERLLSVVFEFQEVLNDIAGDHGSSLDAALASLMREDF